MKQKHCLMSADHWCTTRDLQSCNQKWNFIWCETWMFLTKKFSLFLKKRFFDNHRKHAKLPKCGHYQIPRSLERSTWATKRGGLHNDNKSPLLASFSTSHLFACLLQLATPWDRSASAETRRLPSTAPSAAPKPRKYWRKDSGCVGVCARATDNHKLRCHFLLPSLMFNIWRCLLQNVLKSASQRSYRGHAAKSGFPRDLKINKIHKKGVVKLCS